MSGDAAAAPGGPFRTPVESLCSELSWLLKECGGAESSAGGTPNASASPRGAAQQPPSPRHSAVGPPLTLSEVERSIEGTHTRLEELGAFVDSLSTSTAASAQLLSELDGKTKAVEDLFDRLDKLENFVRELDGSTKRMEQMVNDANSRFRPQGSVKKMLASLLGSRQPKAVTDWKPAEAVLRTDDYFG